MKRAWLYCRIDAPEDRSGALKKQEKQLYDFAEQLGYQIAGTSVDLDQNIELEKLIQEADMGRFDALLVDSLFHIHHDRNQALRYAHEFQSLGIEVFSPLEGRISAGEGSI
ncbi:MAG: recombinase family protein [Oscillospiraceae bacterium]|jgi:DNA invertase Pin-like site-specific DNA recombinase|nr:recombinase family protein [Oscillospiraceae bacterium]MCI2206503.1 recombinase family protein [Oscillospiraceae bacterium]